MVPACFRERTPGGRVRWLLPWRWPFVAGAAVGFAAAWGGLFYAAKNDVLPAYGFLVPDVTPAALSFSRDGPWVAWGVVGGAAVAFAWKRRWGLLAVMVILAAAGLAGATALGVRGLLPAVIASPSDVQPPAPHPPELHVLATLCFGGFLLAAVVCYVLYLMDAVTPIISLLAVSALVIGGYGFVAARAPGGQYLILLLLLCWGLVANAHRHKIRLPTLELDYEVSRRPEAPSAMPLAGTPQVAFTVAAGAAVGGVSAALSEHLTPLPDGAPGRLRIAGERLELLRGSDVLRQASENWNAARLPGMPPLIVVCAAGGGIRAAVYTCAVLEQLEEQTKADSRYAEWFPGQVRLITGASGGMVGAAYYVAQRALGAGKRPKLPRRPYSRAFRRADPPLCPLAQAMARDSLSHTFATMLFHDLPLFWWPGWSAWDRGRALEEAWVRNTTPTDGESPLACPLYALREHEAAARVPSLIFSPMLVEDARRLLISNLDLSGITSSGPRADDAATPDPVFSLSAVEFYQEFPRVRRDFPLCTAARMNASFPYISPAVHLPMDPGRRVVDAGYYDNFGVDVACEWIRRHRAQISSLFGRLVVIQVRPFPCQLERQRRLPYPDAGPLRDVLGPLAAVLAMRQRSPWYRNDQDLADLAELFTETNGPDFFRTAFVECEAEAPLSWNLPTPKAEAVIGDAVSGVTKLLNALGEWAGIRTDGGKS